MGVVDVDGAVNTGRTSLVKKVVSFCFRVCSLTRTIRFSIAHSLDTFRKATAVCVFFFLLCVDLTIYPFVDDLGVSMRLKYGFLLEVGTRLGDAVTIEMLSALVGLYNAEQTTRV